MIKQDFLELLQSENNIYYLIEIKSLNNTLYLTSSDCDIEHNNIIYNSGYLQTTLNLNNIEKTNTILLEIVKHKCEKMSAEELSQAKIKIKMLVCQQSIIIFTGFISSIITNDTTIELTILPNISRLNNSIGELFSPLCRECLGSNKCGIDLNKYKTSGKILEIISSDCFIGTHQETKPTTINYYEYGLIKFTSGKLNNKIFQIKNEQDGKIYLLQTTNMLAVDDTYNIFAGCNKTPKMCKEKFNNIANFRGEPYINNNNF